MHRFSVPTRWRLAFAKSMADFYSPAGHDYALWERRNRWLRKTGINIGMNGVAIDQQFFCLPGLEQNVFIDDYAAIGVGARFWAFGEIRVGKFCMFGADVSLTNGGHDKNTFVPFSGKLCIGSGCWIGNGARIVGPLNIGDNVVVGAGAVVVSDVPAASIVAGVPARLIGMRDLPDRVWHLGNDYFSPKTFELSKD